MEVYNQEANLPLEVNVANLGNPPEQNSPVIADHPGAPNPIAPAIRVPLEVNVEVVIDPAEGNIPVADPPQVLNPPGGDTLPQHANFITGTYKTTRGQLHKFDGFIYTRNQIRGNFEYFR